MTGSIASTRIPLVVLLLLLAATSAAGQDRLAITSVTIVDVTDGSLHTDRTVLVVGDRIAAVGGSGDVAIPAETAVVEGRGGYLIPGLWDMHTHLLWSTDATEHYFTEMPEGVDSWTLWERYYGPTLDLLVANGITGIREMEGNLDVARRVRQRADAQDRFAPRMAVAGHLIDGPPRLWPGMMVVATPEEARSAVDSLAAAGAAFIKVRNRIRPDEYRAIARRTKELGIPLAGHVPWLTRATDAADAGQRSVEHLTGVVEGCSSSQDELIELNRQILDALATREEAVADSLDERMFSRMLATPDDARCRSLLRHLARSDTWQVPTLVLRRGPEHYLKQGETNDEPLLKYVHAAWRTSWAPENDPYGQKTEEVYRQRMRWYERKQDIVGMAAEEGVPILAGSDTPNAFVFPGFGLHEEMQLLVESGLTSLEALQAATINPARFLGAADSLGAVNEGKLADLVLLEANPLEDITNTQRIRAVIVDGRLYHRVELDRLLAEVEASFEQTHRQQ
jgi:imidazolonepropionase-like amidohydrolase